MSPDRLPGGWVAARRRVGLGVGEGVAPSGVFVVADVAFGGIAGVVVVVVLLARIFTTVADIGWGVAASLAMRRG